MGARERLLGRSIPPVSVTIRADFSPESDAAQAELDAASLALRQAEASDAGISGARVRVKLAQEAMGPYLEVLQAVALPPFEHDALVSDHPPTADQEAKGAVWNVSTFPAALLAACLLQDGEPVMPADDWAQWAKTPGAAASGEFVTLFNICMQANDRSPDVSTGKGFGLISN